MTTFDKICACMAFVLGVVLMILGVTGAIVGCNAHFSLPPLLGAVPAFVGWGVVRPIIVAWKSSSIEQVSVPMTNTSIPSGPLRPRSSEDNGSKPV